MRLPFSSFRLSACLIALTVAVGVAQPSAADASPVPALLQNTAYCPEPTTPPPACTQVIEPSSFWWTGDGSAGLNNLHWIYWDAQEAQATGMLVLRTGNWNQAPTYGWHSYPVRVFADFPVWYQGRYLYSVVYTAPLHHPQQLLGYTATPDLPQYEG
jgi:hypothetical protein